MIIGLLTVTGGLVAIKGQQIGQLIAAGKQAEAAGPPPESVGTVEAGVETWDEMIEVVGTVEAGKGVTLTNDAPGVVTAVRFDSGARVRRGDVLVELDTSVERAQLDSALARQDLAFTTATRTQTLVEASIMATAQLETDEASRKAATAEVAAIRAQVDRKVVRAPFAGRLGIREVNLGQYLGPGTRLAVLQSTDEEYVDFSIPQQRLRQLQVGTPVRLALSGEQTAPIPGAITAIEPLVDPSTRSVKLRASAKDESKLLRPGMFVQVTVVLPEKRRVVVVPATSVVRASYGDSVFVIEHAPTEGERSPRLVARQRFVRTSETRGDFIAVDHGLEGGETLVAVGSFKLRNGVGVVVDNTVGQQPEKNPHPEER